MSGEPKSHAKSDRMGSHRETFIPGLSELTSLVRPDSTAEPRAVRFKCGDCKRNNHAKCKGKVRLPRAPRGEYQVCQCPHDSHRK